MTAEMLSKSAIFVDGGHLQYQLYDEGWRIDYKKLLDYFMAKGYFPMLSFYYEGMITSQSYFDKHPDDTFDIFNKKKKLKKAYFERLRGFGYIVRHKPVHRLFDKSSGNYKFKCNFDVELTIDAVETSLTKDIDVFLFCTGDGDHTPLLKFLKNRNKKVVVAGFKKSLNATLLETANETIFIEVIRDKIEELHK